MATEYKIRARNITKDHWFHITILGAFDPVADVKDPSYPNDEVDLDSVTIISQTEIPEEFTLKDNYGIQLVASYPSSLSAFDAVTHDIADKTTWWTHAVVVSGETLTTSDNLTYNFANDLLIEKRKIIDLRDFPTNKELKLYIDGVSIDYYDDSLCSVNFRDGTVTFISSQSGKTITADYAYVDESLGGHSKWRLTPTNGSVIAVNSAKVKFSKNVNLSDKIVFDIGIDPNIVPGGIAQRRIYYALKDFIGFSTRWEVLPAIGSYSYDIVHLLFDYQGAIILDSAKGMYIEVSLENDIQQTSEIALCTFQCVKLKG